MIAIIKKAITLLFVIAVIAALVLAIYLAVAAPKGVSTPGSTETTTTQ